MTHVVLFHSGLGLTRHVRDWGRALEEAGHTVTVPDLYDGETFADLASGVAKRDALGIPELQARSEAAVRDLPLDVVYAGFSLGAASAQALALHRPGARGLVLMHAALPPAMLGASTWPEALRAQIHYAQADPWVDADAVAAMAGLAPDGDCEVFTYAGASHLFGFEGYVDHVAEHAALMRERVLGFLGTLD